MSKILIEQNGILFYCPACQTHHEINKSNQFNNDVNKPTFDLPISFHFKTFNEFDELGRGILGTETIYNCHSIITNGKIEYLPDSTHNLKNSSFELPDNF